MFFVFLNSFYSFYWDVAKDWDLTLFSKLPARCDPDYPWGLRRYRYFRNKEIYYGAIVIDLLLRCTWSFKLSPHLDHFNDLEGGIFLMEILEVFRRWVWIFFRVETEWGKSPEFPEDKQSEWLSDTTVRNNRSPAIDDVVLGEYNAQNMESYED